jgi:hypothetical protein
VIERRTLGFLGLGGTEAVEPLPRAARVGGAARRKLRRFSVCCRTVLRRDHVSCGPAGVGAGMNSIPCRWPIAGTLAKSSGIVRTSRFTSLKNAEE